MATQSQQVWLYWIKEEWMTTPAFELKIYESDETDTRILIRSWHVSFDVPENFDPASRQIEAMMKMVTKIQAAAEAKTTELRGKINNLLALSLSNDEPRTAQVYDFRGDRNDSL